MEDKKQEVFDLLSPFYYMATLREGFPRMRPMGFVRLMNGKLYFGMSRQKNVYQELCSDPHMEFCNTGKGGKWTRVRGIAVEETDPAALQALQESLHRGLENAAPPPELIPEHDGHGAPSRDRPDGDEDFAFLYLDRCTAELCSGPSIEIIEF